MKHPKNLSAVALEAQKREVENLLALAKSGRTFTAAQRRTLAELTADGHPDRDPDGPPNFVQSIKELCRELGISKGVFSRLRRKPGAPRPRSDSRLSVGEWRDFMEQHSLPAPAADPSDAERVRFCRILHRLFKDGIIMLCPTAKD